MKFKVQGLNPSTLTKSSEQANKLSKILEINGYRGRLIKRKRVSSFALKGVREIPVELPATPYYHIPMKFSGLKVN